LCSGALIGCSLIPSRCLKSWSIPATTWADFLVAAAPGGAGTQHLINADVLAALGPQGYLVNVGRAPESRTAATALILANLNAHFAGKPLPSPVSIKV
jgi:hypothetical protein